MHVYIMITFRPIFKNRQNKNTNHLGREQNGKTPRRTYSTFRLVVESWRVGVRERCGISKRLTQEVLDGPRTCHYFKEKDLKPMW